MLKYRHLFAVIILVVIILVVFNILDKVQKRNEWLQECYQLEGVNDATCDRVANSS